MRALPLLADLLARNEAAHKRAPWAWLKVAAVDCIADREMHRCLRRYGRKYKVVVVGSRAVRTALFDSDNTRSELARAAPRHGVVMSEAVEVAACYNSVPVPTVRTPLEVLSREQSPTICESVVSDTTATKAFRKVIFLFS